MLQYDRQEASDRHSGSLESSRELLHADLELCIRKSDQKGFNVTTERIKKLGQDHIAEAKLFIASKNTWTKSKISQSVADFLVNKDALPVTNQYHIHNALKNCALNNAFRPAIRLGIALSKATDVRDPKQLEVIKNLLRLEPESQFVGLIAALRLGILTEIKAVNICFNNEKDPFNKRTGSDPRLKAYMIGYLAQIQYADKAEPLDLARITRTISDYLKTSTVSDLALAFVPKSDMVNQTRGIFGFTGLFKKMPSFSDFCGSVSLRQISDVLGVINSVAEEDNKRFAVKNSIIKALRMLAKDNQTFQEQVTQFDK